MDKGRINGYVIAGSAILVFFLFVAIFAEQLMPYRLDEMSTPYAKPSEEHLLGTNDIGQDILSELIYGTRATLFTGILAAVCVVCLGTGIGLLGGYFGGKIDIFLKGMTSVFMALPQLPLTIVLVTFLKPSIWNIVIAICLTSWTTTARIVRTKVIAVKEQPFIKSEQALGQKSWKIMIFHILPNILDIVLMRATLAVSSAMLTEASLSFLGLGVYNQKSWGFILYYAFHKNGVIIGSTWWYVPPIICISLCIFAFMLIGYYGFGAAGEKRQQEYEVIP